MQLARHFQLKRYAPEFERDIVPYIAVIASKSRRDDSVRAAVS